MWLRFVPINSRPILRRSPQGQQHRPDLAVNTGYTAAGKAICRVPETLAGVGVIGVVLMVRLTGVA